MKPRPTTPARRRAETWLWTGPAGHFLGGALDFLQALAHYARARYAGGRIKR